MTEIDSHVQQDEPQGNYLQSLQRGALTDQQIIDRASEAKQKQDQFKSLENLTKDEAIALLKTMMRDVGVCSTWKWDDAYRNIKNDERYQFLNMPNQEKKVVFADFLHEVRDEERQQQQLKKQRQR